MVFCLLLSNTLGIIHHSLCYHMWLACASLSLFAIAVVCTLLLQLSFCCRDEELLGQGLELNDALQTLLAKHDAIAFGPPLPTTQVTNSGPKPAEVCASSHKSTEVSDSSPRTNGTTPPPVATVTRGFIDDEDDEEDDFAQLARRLFN